MSFQTCIIFFSLWNSNWDARNEIQARMQRKQMVLYSAKIQNAPWKWYKSSLEDLCTVSVNEPYHSFAWTEFPDWPFTKINAIQVFKT